MRSASAPLIPPAPAPRSRQPKPTPVRDGLVVDDLVVALADVFGFDRLEQRVLRLLLCGAALTTIAARLDVPVDAAQFLVLRILAETGTDTRGRLFGLGLRLVDTGARPLDAVPAESAAA